MYLPLLRTVRRISSGSALVPDFRHSRRVSKSCSHASSAPISPSFSSPHEEPTLEIEPEEIAKINTLIPKLSKSGHLREAIALLDTSLLAGVPLNSLPIYALLHHICSVEELNMNHSMALLTALLHNPKRTPEMLTTICAMTLEIYLNNGKLSNALKVFAFMRRKNSLCKIEGGLCGKMVGVLCHHGRSMEAMKVVREMVGGCGIMEEVRESVYMGFLHDARVREGKEVDEVLRKVVEGDEKACERALVVIDRILMNWKN